MTTFFPNFIVQAATPVPLSASGQITNSALGPTLQGFVASAILPFGADAFFNSFIPNLITLLLVIGVLFFVLKLIQAGIRWIMSEGEKANLQAAKDHLTNAIIGLFVLFSTFAIIKIIETFFGLKLTTIDLTPLYIK